MNKEPTAEGQLKRSAFTISEAAESNGMGDVHWRSDKYVTLSSALSVMEANNAVEEYKANKCNEEGRVMFPSGKSAFGENKCSRCGYTEPWQYDF